MFSLFRAEFIYDQTHSCFILPDVTSPVSARRLNEGPKRGAAIGGRNKPSGQSDSGSGESTLYGEGGSTGIEVSVGKSLNFDFIESIRGIYRQYLRNIKAVRTRD